MKKTIELSESPEVKNLLENLFSKKELSLKQRIIFLLEKFKLKYYLIRKSINIY